MGTCAFPKMEQHGENGSEGRTQNPDVRPLASRQAWVNRDDSGGGQRGLPLPQPLPGTPCRCPRLRRVELQDRPEQRQASTPEEHGECRAEGAGPAAH